MRKTLRKAISAAISVVLCGSLLIPAFAANLGVNLTWDQQSYEKKSEAQTATLTVALSEELMATGYGVGVTVANASTGETDGITISSISNDYLGALGVASTGKISWLSTTAQAMTTMATVVFDIPADTVGTYNVNLTECFVSDSGWNQVISNGTYTTTLTITDPDAPATSGYTVAIADTTEGTAEVEPGDTVTMNVTVSGADYHGMQATVQYNADLFTYVSGGVNNSNTVNGINSTVNVASFSASTKTDGSTAATLAFTANSDVSGTGEFTLTTAKAGTFTDAADAQNAPEANTTGDSVTVLAGTASTYDVTLGDGLNGAATATNGNTYCAMITDYDENLNDYAVTVTIDGADYTGFDRINDTIAIPGDDITGAIAITVTKTDKYTVGIKADYVTGWSLVTVTGRHGGYQYNDNKMIKVEAYAVNGDATYAWLVEGTVTEDTVRNAVTTSTTYTTAVTANNYDVNKSGTVDFYDALAAFGCYNIVEDYPVANYVELYLRCDVDGDKDVDAADFSAVMAAY